MKKVLIVFGIILIVGIIICGVGYIILDSESVTREFAKTEEVTGVEEIVVDIACDDIIVKQSETNMFYIEYYTSKLQTVEYSFKDGKISFITERKFFIDFMSLFTKKDLIIYLPNDFTGDFKIVNTSGKIEIEDVELNVNELSLTLTSGKISAEDITANKVSVKGSSGNIRLDNINCPEATVVITSGKFEINDSIITELSVNSTTGAINLDGCKFDTLMVKTTSGNIEGEIQVTTKATCRVSSGDIELKFKNTLSLYKIDYSGTSGDLRIYKNNELFAKIENNIIYGDGDIELVCGTTSGSVKLSFIE